MEIEYRVLKRSYKPVCNARGLQSARAHDMKKGAAAFAAAPIIFIQIFKSFFFGPASPTLRAHRPQAARWMVREWERMLKLEYACI